MYRFWYTQSTQFDSADTVHQILAFGTLEEMKALHKRLGEKKLLYFFLRYPKKIYTAQVLNFIKKFILHISSPIDDDKYLKTTSRYTR